MTYDKDETQKSFVFPKVTFFKVSRKKLKAGYSRRVELCGMRGSELTRNIAELQDIVGESNMVCG